MNTYEHKTNNEMLLDKLRTICFELQQIQYSLSYQDVRNEYTAIIQSLIQGQVIIFDDVYIALQEQLGYIKTEY